MSQDTYAEYTGEDPGRYELGAVTEVEPVPVHDISERRTPEQVSCMTWNIPQAGIGQPVQILQRRRLRYKAKITLVSMGGATSVVFSPKLDTVQGSSPQGCTYSPGAGIQDSFLPDWESQKPCYAIAIGGGPAIVSVQDEAYSGTN